ncbi:MAG: hypothetical protein H5T50_03860 [Nitrososphaeria archaeon]|nr:hypothetical protein [Nitrososphaeria archaeon]
MVLTEEEIKEHNELVKDVKMLLQKGVIGKEDCDVAKMILALYRFGADYEKIKRLANFKDFDICWKNLEENGYFENGKFVIEETESDAQEVIVFLLTIGVAKGLLVRR